MPTEAPHAARLAPKPALARGAICRPFVIVRRVVQVRLDRRLCASQPPGDLRDRQILLLAVVSRKRRGSPSLTNTITHLTPPRAALPPSFLVAVGTGANCTGRAGQPLTA